MSDQIQMRLGNPFFIGIYSLALLAFGAAIGAQWGHSPQVAVWMVVAGAGLMVAHDTVAFAVIFLLSTAWASRANRKREASAAVMQGAVATQRPRRASGAQTQQKE